VNEINASYSKLVNTYTVLREQSGGARLYVVGYPQIAKPGGDCGLNVHLNSDEVEFSSQLIDYLDSVVKRAAETAGVFYVNTQQAFDGHRLCEASAGQSAMNGFTVGNDAGVAVGGHAISFIGAESYHPTALGYQLLAANIAKQTGSLTAKMPTPAPYNQPVLDSTLPFLQNVPAAGRTIAQVTNDSSMADDFAARGDAIDVAVDGDETQLQPGSKYQVVLHSVPVLLDEGGVDSDGNIATTIHIPVDTEPGYHTLHIYAQNMAGDPVDIQKIIYVAASMDDYDGDGILNSMNSCLLFPASGQDVDGDGIDDACDPVITEKVAPAAVAGKVPTGDQSLTDQVVPSASVTSDVNIMDPSTGAVLGESVESQQPNPIPTDDVTRLTPGDQKLFRLNWLAILAEGLVLSGVCTALYCCIHRE